MNIDAESAALGLFETLQKYRLIFASAESLTGGMIGEKFTSIPGASAFFWGGVIAYTPDAKIRALQTPPETIARRSVVSAEVARCMALGVLELSGADCAVSVTGVAGPGAFEGIPAGTVWMGAAARGGVVEERRLELKGAREEIRLQTAEASYRFLRELIERLYRVDC